MATILLTHGVPMAGFEALTDHRIIAPAPLAAFSLEELMGRIHEADVVIAGGKLPGEVIRAGKRLRHIANYGAGYDGVDVRTAAACGIPVTNIPNAVTDATAELAIGLMLAVSRRIGEMNLRLRREPSETLFGMGRHMGHTLQRQTLGVIGCGRIGQQVVRIASAFGMRCISYRNASALPPQIDEVENLAALLTAADIVTLHCPLTERTRHLLSAKEFALMKPGAMLINTARGGVIDTAALVDALQTGHLAGAGLDVYPDEPHIPEALLALPNVVCTPHVGSNTAETRAGMARAISVQILDVLAGKRPTNIVNGL